MAPILSFIVGSLLAVRALADPFEKLYSTPEGTKMARSLEYSLTVFRMEATKPRGREPDAQAPNRAPAK
jgi:hypothetical protein